MENTVNLNMVLNMISCSNQDEIYVNCSRCTQLMNYSFAKHKDRENNAFYQPQLDVHWKEFPSIVSFLLHEKI